AARIEELSRAGETLRVRIGELEGLTEQKALSDMEFDLMRQLLTNFRDSIDAMSVEEKRAAVRTLIRKVVWDGEFAHVVLFGASEDEIEYPDLQPLISAGMESDSDLETLSGENSE
ncbi:MAG: recombinase family protein, partial [Oscillibacter sp.]|nr:recombinase family protein [Oscillibacter sp.]